MPELPEVEHVRRTLVPHLVGQRLTGVTVRRATVVAGPATERALLVGSTIAGIERHGKQLAMLGDSGRVVVVQLGMSGQVLCDAESRPELPTHVHIVWRTSRGASILFRDPRRFGGITPLESREALLARWSSLGPDALAINPGALAAGLRGSRRAVKAALLDQSVLAGVGNIYADEACFRAGIRPRRSAHRLNVCEVERLAEAVGAVLRAAVSAGGSTLRDYLDADGKPGEYRREHSVYGRGGEACRVCATRLRTGTIAQRTTVWCPRCQG